MLYRDALGCAIRDARLKNGLTLRDVASTAPMALSYLSEVERGQKELSSELLERIAPALRTTVSELVIDASMSLALDECDTTIFDLERLGELTYA
jgi:transcriptional regulator with XRE-family HTH domain